MVTKLYPPHILRDTVGLYPRKTMVSQGKVSYSYEESWRIVQSLALRFDQLRVKGNVVVCMANSPEFIFTVFALFAIGAVPIPLNPRCTSCEVTELIRRSGAVMLATSEEGGMFFRLLGSDRVHRFATKELLGEAGSFACAEEANPCEKAVMFYTSGSTGEMKGVVHTFQSLCSNTHVLVEVMKIQSEDIYFLGVPLFHLFGFSPGMLSAVVSGAEMVLSDSIGSIGVGEKVERNKVSVLLCNASMLEQVVQRLTVKECDVSSLRLVLLSGSIAAEQLLTKSIARVCRNTLNLYGSTETGIMCQTLPGENVADLTGTVGRPLRGIDIRIVDDDGKQVPVGSVGEIACRSFSLFSEYHNMPSVKEKVVDRDKWDHTGDMGTINTSGYVTVVGRKDEMIVKAGFNIYPREVELVLLQHPNVKEAAVVGIGDATHGQTIRAVVTRKKEEEQLTDSELRELCYRRLVSYKVPDEIVIAKALPLTSTGKICKSKLGECALLQST